MPLATVRNSRDFLTCSVGMFSYILMALATSTLKLIPSYRIPAHKRAADVSTAHTEYEHHF